MQHVDTTAESVNDTLKPHPAAELTEDMTFEAWQSQGERLCGQAKVLYWQIGDWWIAGSSRYGARAKVAAKGIFGLEFGTLRNAGVVARKFETSRRRDALSFKHHAEVAALPTTTADAFLAQAEAEKLSTRNLRMIVSRFKAHPGARPELEPPTKPKAQPVPKPDIISPPSADNLPRTNPRQDEEFQLEALAFENEKLRRRLDELRDERDADFQAEADAAARDLEIERDERIALAGADELKIENDQLRKQIGMLDRRINALINENNSLKYREKMWKERAEAAGWKERANG